MLPLIDLEHQAGASERQLRRQLDLATARAIVDREYAERLLGDPIVAVGAQGCTPQQYTRLRQIQADTVQEFARQALALFWPGDLGIGNTDARERGVARAQAASTAAAS